MEETEGNMPKTLSLQELVGALYPNIAEEVAIVLNVGRERDMPPLEMRRRVMAVLNNYFWEFTKICAEGKRQKPRPVKASYRTIVIDVDSTLCGIEGIDELARLKGKYREVSAMTEGAMNGAAEFGHIFAERLSLIAPERNDLAQIAKRYVQTVTPGAKETLALLRTEGVDVHIVSGGYYEALLPLADYLGIPEQNVHANHLEFENGKYAGFDAANPLCRSGGKSAVIKRLKASDTATLPIAIIGDSVSDIVETAQDADLRIGFGGYVRRLPVIRHADVFVLQPHFEPLAPILLKKGALLQPTTDAERARVICAGMKGLEHTYFAPRVKNLLDKVLEVQSSQYCHSFKYSPNSPFFD